MSRLNKIYSFFASLIGAKGATVASSNSAKPIQKGHAQGKARVVQSPSVASRKTKNNSSRLPAKPVGRSSVGITVNRISNSKEIPEYQELLSANNGQFALTEKESLSHAVLLIDKLTRRVAIICATDGMKTGSADHLYASLKERCVAKGFTVTRYLASRNIIRILYESSKANSLSSDTNSSETSQLVMDYYALLTAGLDAGASDIHIEIRRDHAHVRFRINGALRLHEEWSIGYANTMASTVYQVVAEEKDVTFNRFQAQSAIVNINLPAGSLRVRLETLPAYPDGLDMVMRLLPLGGAQKSYSIQDMGYAPDQIRIMNQMISSPTGVIIIAGTTGSGKSTLLCAMLNNRISERTNKIKVITVEDPPEQEIKGATQVPVDKENKTNPFGRAIKSAMRCDPDILMVGEVRDSQSAELLIGAVQSGHQAFTTVHASSAISIVARLRSKSLGVPVDVLGSRDFISGLIYQKLVPVVCDNCSTTLKDFHANVKTERGNDLLSRLFEVVDNIDDSKVRFKNPNGCSKCVDGINGRTVAAETIMPDAFMLECFSQRKDAAAWRHYRKKGGKSALDHGIDKIAAGICDPFDVEEALGLLTSELHEDRSYSDLEASQESVDNGSFEEDSGYEQADDPSEQIVCDESHDELSIPAGDLDDFSWAEAD